MDGFVLPGSASRMVFSLWHNAIQTPQVSSAQASPLTILYNTSFQCLALTIQSDAETTRKETASVKLGTIPFLTLLASNL